MDLGAIIALFRSHENMFQVRRALVSLGGALVSLGGDSISQILYLFL